MLKSEIIHRETLILHNIVIGMLHEAEKYIEKSADLKSYEQQKLSHCLEIESADHVLFYLFRCI